MMNQMPYGCTLKDYRKSYAKPEHYKSIKTNSIVGYVMIVLNLVVAGASNPWGLIDVAIQTICVYGVHQNRSKGCAIGLVVYSVISMLLGLMSSGTITGWLWLVLGISYMNTFKKIDKDYQEALANQQRQQYNPYGQYPQYPR